jgi:CHASE3 domain sensor protein
MASGLLVIVLLLTIVAFLVLYVLIRSEASSTTITDRADAEREAREFGGRDGPTRRD